MKNRNKQTKFPVARIKKIMQKDEDVGKVAQATPVVISKALELFLALIVEEASKVTTDRGSKKVEAYHLKHAVETTEMFDFLKEIVEAVPDPSAGGTIDLEAEAAEERKRRKSKGKKAAAIGPDGQPAAPKRRRKKKEEEVPERSANEDNETEDEDKDEDHGRRRRNAMDVDDEEEEDDDEDKPFMPRR